MLSIIYSPEYLAAMVLHRYLTTPCICNYKMIISESILAHFSGLDHIAVTGLMPVIEGAGLSIAKKMNISIKKMEATKSLPK